MIQTKINIIVIVVVNVVVSNVFIHGLRHTRLYSTWCRIKRKCYNPNDDHYKYYGARGIKVCDEWLNNPKAFYNWSMENGYQNNLTIDRIDVNGNYEPNNCRWVDMSTQVRNRRNTIYLTYKGETKPLMEWCEILHLKYGTIKRRYYKGWDAVKILEYRK